MVIWSDVPGDFQVEREPLHSAPAVLTPDSACVSAEVCSGDAEDGCCIGETIHAWSQGETLPCSHGESELAHHYSVASRLHFVCLLYLRESLACGPDWPRIHHVAQAALNLRQSCICLQYLVRPNILTKPTRAEPLSSCLSPEPCYRTA